jgi:pimeloyl-ACP methyl ester carboxylesterase
VELKPRLIEVAVPDRPDGAVLLLHGGASRRRTMMVSPTQLSVLRMIPIAKRVVKAGGGRLAVFRLLNSRRGWDTHHTPVEDARWGLDEIARRLGGRLPTCLIGHSLGGRAALLSAAEPEVVSVAALAPWVYPSDVPAGLDGQRILIVHGLRDRIASPARAAALAERLRSRASVAFVTVEDGRHAMLRHHRDFDGLAADFASATLLGETGNSVLARIEAGEALVSL